MGSGKSWNFVIMAFCRTRKSGKKATWSRIVWKSVKTQLKNMKCMEGSKKNSTSRYWECRGSCEF